MTRPRGIDHFLSYLKGLEGEYVVIGGGAAAILMDDEDLTFRATKDVDLVLLSNGSKELNARISAYVRDGKYNSKEATDTTPRYYRFRKPASEEYPEMIEIFARNDQSIELHDGQYIIPVQSDEVARISAILLDDEYFEIIKANIVKTKSEASVINTLGNICLKARAHRELSEKQQKGDKVDSKDIAKHRNDILRMAPTLTGNEKIKLGEKPKKDLALAMVHLRAMPAPQFKDMMSKNFPGVKHADLIGLIEKVFLSV